MYNRKLAATIATVVIALTILLNGCLTLSGTRYSIVNNGINSMKQIDEDLAENLAMADRMQKIAFQYLSDTDNSLAQLRKSKANLEKSSSNGDKYINNIELTSNMKAVYDALEGLTNENDEQFRISSWKSTQANNLRINNSKFNANAEKFNNNLSAFPTFLFKIVSGTNKIQLFR